MGGVAVAIYAVQVLLRMREEEARGRLEAVLSSAVSRPRWVMSYVMSTVIGGAALLVAYATAVALTAGQALGGTPDLLYDLNGAALAELPAVLAAAGAVVAVFAVLPRRAVPASWLLLGAAILLSPLFDLEVSQWVRDLSPFSHQKAPAFETSTVAVVALLAVAAAMTAAGVAWFRRRDIAPG
jgi:ABC-2 type transport system permease protein